MSEQQKPRRMAQRSASFLPPLWAVGVMLLLVVMVAAGVVGLVYLLGGNNPLEPAEPIVIVVTGAPTTPVSATTAPDTAPSVTVAPVRGGGERENIDESVPNFVLEGPTLPPVFLSPTPDSLSVGRTVRVINVGEGGLNVRSSAGIDNEIQFRADEGSLLDVVDGPVTDTGDGFTWWQVQEPFTAETGWAVQLYMDVQPEVSP